MLARQNAAMVDSGKSLVTWTMTAVRFSRETEPVLFISRHESGLAAEKIASDVKI
jgi:hypothetical protein